MIVTGYGEYLTQWSLQEEKYTSKFKKLRKEREFCGNDKKYQYRNRNTWVYDSELDSSSFAKTTDLTCSIKLDSIKSQNEMMEKYGEK